jgi:hypothetical protein
MEISVRLKSPAITRFWRSIPLVLLVSALLGAPAVLADDPIPSTITVYAPGAPVGVPVSVQRQVGSGWMTVGGSTATLFNVTDMAVPYQTWTLDPNDYGQGPFRWVIENQDGRTVWATGDPFFLPMTGGIDLAQIIGPADTQVGTPIASANSDKTMKTIPAPAFQAPVLTAASRPGNTLCNLGDCASAQISAYITGVPVTSWIAVEWLNNQGYWQPVQNWEGPSDLVDTSSQLIVKQWAVSSSEYGRGLFRWAIYRGAHGGVLGVSPSFNLPSSDRQNDVMYLSY